jgi:hypothetical protein
VTALLLANVGLRDVTRNGEPLRSPRADGEEILEQFDSCRHELQLPMLFPAVAELLADHGAITVVLYGTDQPEDTPEVLRAKDSFNLARVAIKLLESRYGRKKIADGSRAKPIRANPSLYDDMLAFFCDQLSTRQQWTKQIDVCAVFPVGGTPAANMGMVLAAVERFGESCKTLYLPHGEMRPVQMDLGRQIRQRVLNEQAADRLRDMAFESAVPLLERADSPRWIVELARYATARYHFDFKAASSNLDAAIAECGDDWNRRSACSRLRQGLSRLRERRPESLLEELFHNAALSKHHGEYAAFLGHLFRFQEALLRHMVETLFPGLPTDRDEDGSWTGFLDGVHARSGLLAFLEAEERDRHLRWREPNRLAFDRMVRFAIGELEGSGDTERADRYARAHEAVNRLDCLSGLRNDSIIAHGYEGVSWALIQERYARHGGDPLETMRQALGTLGIPVGESPFEAIMRLTLEGLETP